jgi:hypothetical protein
LRKSLKQIFANLVNVRNTRCTAPGCGQPAARCDLDHTTPWHHGGPTCPCDLAPPCRHHHRCKQAEGWRLEQPEPGILAWRTPAGRTWRVSSGRTSTTGPTIYTLQSPEDWSDSALAKRIDRAAVELVLLMESGFAHAVREESWESYQHEYGSAGGTELSIDLDTDLMRLATGGSAG